VEGIRRAVQGEEWRLSEPAHSPELPLRRGLPPDGVNDRGEDGVPYRFRNHDRLREAPELIRIGEPLDLTARTCRWGRPAQRGGSSGSGSSIPGRLLREQWLGRGTVPRQPLTAAANASARSVRSQVITSSSRPKWP
jgi:hypothetical protein